MSNLSHTLLVLTLGRTFFQEPGEWPLMDSADPLDGWLHADYMPYTPIAKADVYGGLFYFLRDIFSKFSNRVRNTSILFQLYSMDAEELPEYLPQDGKAFDRIEVCYTLPLTHETLVPLHWICASFIRTVPYLKRRRINQENYRLLTYATEATLA
jgi:hypothetical protein